MATASGKVVLVSGAARGYGPAIARCFAARGAIVALHDKPELLTELVAELERQDQKAFIASAEFGDALAIQRMVDEIYRRQGRLDVLVTLPEPMPDGALLGIAPAEWLDVFQRNVHRPFFAMQAAARYMLLDRRGRIVNVTGVPGSYPQRSQAASAAVLGALNALTKALAVELAAKQIAVNAVAPGVPAEAGEASLQRPVRHEDVAELVAFLASDEASYIAGELHYVDGGLAGRR